MGCSACSRVAKIASKLGSPALLLISCIYLRFPVLAQSLAVPVCFFPDRLLGVQSELK